MDNTCVYIISVLLKLRAKSDMNDCQFAVFDLI